MRAKRLCPLVEHADEIRFDPRFLRAVERVGKILVKDEKCFEFLMKNTEEITDNLLVANERIRVIKYNPKQ